MIRLILILLLSTTILLSCNDNKTNPDQNTNAESTKEQTPAKTSAKHFEGSFTNGMKGDKISFDITADGKTLSNLTFKGYWRCGGRLESTTAGPQGVFTLVDNKVNDHISEPPNGGSTAWRYDLQATITGNTASGTFRMNINNLGCDTYKLIWSAAVK